MASSTLEPEVATQFVTVADLIAQFGPILAGRMRLSPAPGTATVDDVIAIHAREKRLCELVDGILVEKTVGYEESKIASLMVHYLWAFVLPRKLGDVLGADGMFRLNPDLVRIPDASFVSIEQLPGGEKPKGQIPSIHPDLAVEVLSPSNTKAEMDRKLHDYFESGVTLVWYMDPIDRTVRVYTSPEDMTLIDESGTLDGGEVLPGFTMTLREWLDDAGLLD